MSIEESSRTLSVLSRALTHVIRGDLSVITNDLTYLGGMVPDGEVDRAKTRCANIAQFLGKLAVLQNAFTPRQCTLVDFSKSCLKSEVSDVAPWSGCEVRCDLQQAKVVFGIVTSLISSPGTEGTSSATVNVEADMCTVLHSGARVDEPLGHYRVLSDFASSARGERAVVDAAVCDLILQMHGWSGVVSVTDTTVDVSVAIPWASRTET
jgi:hypothetical protein